VAGDGTTTATVLAQALVHEGLRAVASGANPVGLKRGIEKAVDAVVEELRSISRAIDTTSDMASVATISSRDETIGALIAEAFDKVGKDGVITVDESQTFGTELDFTEGMQFDKGYLSPYMVTDQDRMEAVIEDPYILIHSGKISSMNDLLPLLEKVIAAHGSLFIVAEDVDGEALSTLVVNKIRGTFSSVAVKAPAFGDRRKAMLQDIATLTGGQVVAPEVGLKLDQVGLEVLGRAKKVVVTKDNTTIVDGAGDKADVEGRVIQLRAEYDNSDSEWDRETKVRFGNDPLNLVATSRKLNQEKSDALPAEWLPPTNRCEYSRRLADIARKYSLPLPSADVRAMQRQCRIALLTGN